MAHPVLRIDLDKIEHNTRTIVELCARFGITVTGVTKATHGDPEVAAAMIRGGVGSIGEARLESARRLKAAGITVPFVLLTVPSPDDAAELPGTIDVSLNTEWTTLSALSQAALKSGHIQKVLIMVELGDLREGVLPEELPDLLERTKTLKGVRLTGIGTNLTCFGGVVPTPEIMGRLVALARAGEAILGHPFDWVSGLNSSGLKLLASGLQPAGITHARIGEAILLGRETTQREPWPKTFQDAFQLQAEVIELKRKPSRPAGDRGEDAFGHVPTFEDRGVIDHAILNIGREDVDIDQLFPEESRLAVLGGSSEYVIVDASRSPHRIAVGDMVRFRLGYAAVVTAMASAYVEKRYTGGAGR